MAGFLYSGFKSFTIQKGVYVETTYAQTKKAFDNAYEKVRTKSTVHFAHETYEAIRTGLIMIAHFKIDAKHYVETIINAQWDDNLIDMPSSDGFSNDFSSIKIESAHLDLIKTTFQKLFKKINTNRLLGHEMDLIKKEVYINLPLPETIWIPSKDSAIIDIGERMRNAIEILQPLIPSKVPMVHQISWINLECNYGNIEYSDKFCVRPDCYRLMGFLEELAAANLSSISSVSKELRGFHARNVLGP